MEWGEGWGAVGNEQASLHSPPLQVLDQQLQHGLLVDPACACLPGHLGEAQHLLAGREGADG